MEPQPPDQPPPIQPAATPDNAPRFAPNRGVVERASATWMGRALEQPDAPEFGPRKILAQVHRDLFGTKDVQNVITASYVWQADQIGHLALGLILTLLACWVIRAFGVWLGWPMLATGCVMAGAGIAVFGYWVYKEHQDLNQTRNEAKGVFPFDLSDIVWNVQTALLYLGAGGVLGVCAFLNACLLLAALLVLLWPALMVAYWWLRRKLAFQQAGLPYLYRLANFDAVFDAPEEGKAVAVVSGLCDLREQPVSVWHVLTGRDPIMHRAPEDRHILITGPLRSGKTSLAVGIGTEFAFVLGMARYVSAADLVELAASKPQQQTEMDYDDGRVLWPWNRVDLLIVDDVDAGVAFGSGTAPARTVCSLVRPDDFSVALRAGSGLAEPLSWLREKRSLWVIGDPSQEAAWRQVIAALMGADPAALLTVQLRPAPP